MSPGGGITRPHKFCAFGVGENADGAVAATTPEPEVLTPALSIRKSVSSRPFICLTTGLLQILEAASGDARNEPDKYRAKWNPPADYPMVAPNYAAARSALAKNMGLGQKRRKRG